MTKRTLWTLLAALFALPAVLGADSDELDPTAEARLKAASGRYGDALSALAEVEAELGASPATAAYRAELLLETGRYGEASAAAGKFPADPRGRMLLAESLVLQGRREEAKAAFDAAIKAAPALLRARYGRAMLLLEMGDREAAREEFAFFFEHYRDHEVSAPEDLVHVALASMRYGELSLDVEMEFEPTLRLLQNLVRTHEDYLPGWIALGELYLAVYQDQDALKALREVSRRNSRYPAARYALAEQALFRFQDGLAIEHCRQALRTNPNFFPAREYLAATHLGDGRIADARKEIEAVLAVNPARKEARALAAAALYLEGDREAFAQAMAGILAEDPRFGAGYVVLSKVLEDQRRFGEAAEVAGLAVKADPDDWRAHYALGRNLVHVAEEEKGREALEASRRLDPYAQYDGHPFRENLREVLGHIGEFAESRTENFIYRIHVGENDSLSPYYHSFMEDSWDLLTKKYGFTPEGPILAEVFHRHDDFSARTIGLPAIGALGACFGKVITLDSPSARERGEFCWASTAHHEFAHVMTLQLSNGRVPRWFTEGMSVYEERAYADWWERDMDRRLFDVVKSDELPKVATFNTAFRTGDVLLAYYLGGMMCEYIVGEHGMPKVVEMLRAWGTGAADAEVFQSVLGLSLSEFDRNFAAWAAACVADWKLTPRWSNDAVVEATRRASQDAKDFDARMLLAEASAQRRSTVDAMHHLGKALEIRPGDPRILRLRGALAVAAGRADQAQEWYGKFFAAGGEDFDARLALARIAEQENDFEAAAAHYEKAKAAFPRAPEPFAALARLKKGAEDLAGWAAEAEGFVKLAGDRIDERLELADWYEHRGEWEALERVLTEVVLIHPLGEDVVGDVQVRLADVRVRLGRPEDAAREYEAALAIGVPQEEEAAVRTRLAKTYVLLGRIREARFQAAAALEIDPSHGPARELLDQHPER